MTHAPVLFPCTAPQSCEFHMDRYGQVCLWFDEISEKENYQKFICLLSSLTSAGTTGIKSAGTTGISDHTYRQIPFSKIQCRLMS